jgi:hypothetical protein
VLAVFVAVSSLPLGLLVWRDLVTGWIWIGSDAGAAVQDQWQYVSFIREAAEHVVVSNHYRAEPGEASYLHPAAVLSAVLVKLGVAPKVVYLLWKPLAVLGLFAAVTAYVRRLVPAGTQRWIALVLALFYLPPVIRIFGKSVDWTVTSGELWPIDMLWGYYYSALGMAGMVAALLLYERDRASGRVTVWPLLVALLAAWLQPWSGALTIGVAVGAEAWIEVLRRRSPAAAAGLAPGGGRSPLRVLAPLVVAAGAPLAYYTVLGRVDPSWRIDNGVDAFLAPPWSALLITIAPLALPALLAYRFRPASFQEAAVRVWPPVALALFWVLANPLAGRYAPHAFRALSIPLAVLAVVGLAGLRLPRSRAVVAAATVWIGLLVVPGTLDRLDDFRERASTNGQPYFLQRGERAALDYLDRDPTPGSVLAPVAMGQIIPAETGRRTNVGNIFWTPDFLRRRLFTDIFFRGRLDAAGSQRVVRESGSRFLLSGCDGYADLSELIGPQLLSVRRFGCATVYEIRPSALRSSSRSARAGEG